MKRLAAGRARPGSGLSRRQMLDLSGSVLVLALTGCRPERAGADETAAAPALPSCVLRPQQAEGPYFADERLERSDLRSDPADGSVREGVPLSLAFRVSTVRDTACTPLAGAMVDVWHCDALGVYSDVKDFGGQFDTRGKKFLRGYQLTDDDGVARFITIYPGWYPGRTVHIHFKIRPAQAGRPADEFTSQLYFDDAVTDRVHASAPYAGKGRRTVRNDGDGIFRDGGERLMLELVEDGQGYAGVFDIGLRIA
ncbi:twin-arginine translocation pathway signal protein [Crenobacter cavernae]|uniref:Twin-arginine translocation pathway signal protein n=2 Tax=Crenobacter cavernae TaxID=2290923 RepID=A0ABY0FBI8_9NEIS|nr:twin-arginine translocation pathway signal protein [Crenobacter cavernae]